MDRDEDRNLCQTTTKTTFLQPSRTETPPTCQSFSSRPAAVRRQHVTASARGGAVDLVGRFYDTETL